MPISTESVSHRVECRLTKSELKQGWIPFFSTHSRPYISHDGRQTFPLIQEKQRTHLSGSVPVLCLTYGYRCAQVLYHHATVARGHRMYRTNIDDFFPMTDKEGCSFA